MQLYLVRHGEAVAREIDAERPLSAQGVAAARKMAAFLKPRKIKVEAIWHSTKARARQTAEILSKAVTSKRRLAERKKIGPLDEIDKTLAAVNRAAGDLMIVGHMPFMGRLASALLAGDTEVGFVGFSTVAVACLERDDDERWQLAWLVAPELLA